MANFEKNTNHILIYLPTYKNNKFITLIRYSINATNYSRNSCFANRCMPLRTGYALYFGILYHTLDPVFGFGAQVPSGPSPALYT